MAERKWIFGDISPSCKLGVLLTGVRNGMDLTGLSEIEAEKKVVERLNEITGASINLDDFAALGREYFSTSAGKKASADINNYINVVTARRRAVK